MRHHFAVWQIDDDGFAPLAEILAPPSEVQPETDTRLGIVTGEAIVLAPVRQVGEGRLKGMLLRDEMHDALQTGRDAGLSGFRAGLRPPPTDSHRDRFV